MSSTILENEKRSILKIAEKAKKEGKPRRIQAGLMPHPRNMSNPKRRRFDADSYDYQTEDGTRLWFAENADLNKRNGDLQKELDTEKTRVGELETSLESANKNLESAHEMLGKAYDFITRVRESIPGKVFFKKDLANLSMDPTALPKGTQDDRTDER